MESSWYPLTLCMTHVIMDYLQVFSYNLYLTSTLLPYNAYIFYLGSHAVDGTLAWFVEASRRLPPNKHKQQFWSRREGSLMPNSLECAQ